VKKDFPLLVENAQIHPTGVQINPAIMLMGFGVESHVPPPFLKIRLKGAYLVGLLREESLMSIKIMKTDN
jgi:hypothetical protein